MSSTLDSEIHIVLSQTGMFDDIVKPLVYSGAILHVLDRGESYKSIKQGGKLKIVFSMFSYRLLTLIHCWKSNDRVLLLGWKSMPILLMIKLGIINKPQRTLVIGCFVHSLRARHFINRLIKALRFEGLGFVTFSKGESENLINNAGILPSSVFFHKWRQFLDGKVPSQDIIEGDYIFSGGYSNRDYDLLVSAVQDFESKVIIVASSRNKIKLENVTNVSVYRDLSASDFESLLAKSKLVIIPLYGQGEACGQSVLLRVLRNKKPLIATRHESIESYLGSDYPGFVTPGDLYALREMIKHAISDQKYRNKLAARISEASSSLEECEPPAQEILGFLRK